MCTLTHLFLPAGSPNATSRALSLPSLPGLSAAQHPTRPPMFQVVPAGIAFFHIRETATGRVRGFRGSHNAACALARSLESRIELLA